MRWEGLTDWDMGSRKVTGVGAQDGPDQAAVSQVLSGVFNDVAGVYTLDPTAVLYERFTADTAADPAGVRGDVKLTEQ